MRRLGFFRRRMMLRSWSGFLTLWTILYRNSLYCTQFGPNRYLNRAHPKLESPEPPRLESPAATCGPSSTPPVSASRRRRSRRKGPRPPVGPTSFRGGAATARCRRRHSGEPVRLDPKPFATLAEFVTSPVGFSRSIDRRRARLFPAMFTRIATVRFWKWGGGRRWLNRKPVWTGIKWSRVADFFFLVRKK